MLDVINKRREHRQKTVYTHDMNKVRKLLFWHFLINYISAPREIKQIAIVIYILVYRMLN